MNLRHRVKIQAPPPKESRNSRGQLAGDWVLIAEVAAGVKGTGGTETERANQLVGTTTHTITIRYPRTFEVTVKHRIVFQGRAFEIGSVVDMDGTRQFLEMKCIEVRK